MDIDNKYCNLYAGAIAKQLSYIKNAGYPGLAKHRAKIPTASNFIEWNDGYKNNKAGILTAGDSNELLVNIPFAGISLVLKLLVNLHEPWISPDIMIADSDFLTRTTCEQLQEKVPCLDSWDFMSEDIIFTLLKQIFISYKEYQMEILKQNELLYFEYKSVLTSLEITPDDIEVSLADKNIWMATWFIRLPLDLKDLPTVLCDANSGEAHVFLHIFIRKSDGVMVPRLHLCPQLEFWINAESVSLPAVPSGSSLTDYTLDIQNRLKLKVKAILMGYEYRKQLIAQLLCNYGGSVLEYDVESFKSAAFLFDLNDFNFIVRLRISDDPVNPDVVISLRSVYHMATSEVSSKPFVKLLDKIQFSTSSTAQETVDKITDHVTKNLAAFRESSVVDSK